MRALVLAALVAAASGCHTEACKSGTLFLTVSLSGAAASATSLSINVAVQGVGQRSGTVSLGGKASGTVEIDFPSYPAGRSVAVTVTALAGSKVLGTESQATVLGAGCATLTLTVRGSSGSDGMVSDLATVDGASDAAPPIDLAPPPDLTGCVPSTSCGSVACGMISDGCSGMVDCGACQLLSLEPAVAPPATLVTLEGTFAGGTTVNFPGGASVAATLLGPHRATVAVPASATTGTVSVTSGGATVGAVPFRTTSFTPSLGTVTKRYEQTEYARPLAAMLDGRAFFATVVTPNYIYVLDGDNNGLQVFDSTERATINSDSTLSFFSRDSSTKLNQVRMAASTVTIANNVYVIGGGDNIAGTVKDSIEQATINSDGTLSPFTLAAVKLATGRQRHSSVVIGNNIYVIGGSDAGNTSMTSVESAPVKSDGSLGKFALVTTSALITPRADATALVTNGWLYIIGGASNGAVSTIERAAINPDGSIGTFAIVPNVTLASVNGRAQQSSVVLGNAIYVIDGQANNGAELTSIEQATINPDGSISTFTASSVSTIYPGRRGSRSVVIGNNVFVLGGDSVDIGVDYTLQRASIDGGGALGSFSPDTTTQLATSRGGFCVVVTGNQMHLIGGTDANGNTVSTNESATIAPDGTLASFAIDGEKLQRARRSHCCAVLGGFVYAIGGYNGSSDSALGDLESAPINADGSLGSFTEAAAPLSPGRYDLSCFAGSGTLYAVGGFVNGGPMAGYQNAIDKSTFDGFTGALGTFAGAGTIPTARAGQRNFVLNDTVYIMGGSGNTAPPIEQTTLGSNDALSSFTTSTPTLSLSHFTTLLLGSNLFVIGGGSMSIQQASFASGSLGSFTTSTATLSKAITTHTFALGNHAYAVGGSATAIESALLP
jgi:hypothetical protein